MSMTNPGSPAPGRIHESRSAELVAAILVRVTALAVAAGGLVTTAGGIGNGAVVVVALGLAITTVGVWLLARSIRRGIRRR